MKLERIPGESREQFDRRQELNSFLRDYSLHQYLPNEDYDSFLEALSDTIEAMMGREKRNA